MSFRASLFAGAMLLGQASALAGGLECGGTQCFRETTLAPVYGTVAERVLLSPPRTVDVVTPARYATVMETVQVGGGRVWQVTRDASGRKVGCWVDLPPVFETRPRTITVRQSYAEPHTYPSVYGSREHTVLVEPAHRAWVPVDAAAPISPAPFGAGVAQPLVAAVGGSRVGGLGLMGVVDPVGPVYNRRF